MAVEAVEWLDNKLRILDQRKLPWEQSFVDLTNYHDVALAIKDMMVRGAPAIGITAAYGIALGAQSVKAANREEFLIQFNKVAQVFSATRPTAVNLFKAINRMRKVVTGDNIPKIKMSLIAEARQIHNEEIEATRLLSYLGAELIKNGFTILTHCNAGPLATTGYGTALGIIKAAKEQGKKISVVATETRPLLQGARLTAWELVRAGIEVTVLCDNAAASLFASGSLDAVITGADRIVLNGDSANKIGTLGLAVFCEKYGVPIYIAAPWSTFDTGIETGEDIPIENRDLDEVKSFAGVRTVPGEAGAYNPAFDVTPAELITAIITEKGII